LLEDFITYFGDLNRNKDYDQWNESTLHQAPHKPLLILAVMDGIKSGQIQEPRIRLTPELIEDFNYYWNVVVTDRHKSSISLPFYHMKSEPFWELVYKEGYDEYNSTPSIGGLKKRVAYAEIDEELFGYMTDPEVSERLRSSLLKQNFSKELARQLHEKSKTNWQAYQLSVELAQYANEPFTPWLEQKEYSEGKIQVRNLAFRKMITGIYNHRCTMCGTRIITPEGLSVVEAGHIIPWSHKGTDDPRNGLALCGTHHWMFDNGVMRIDEEYRIRFHSSIREEQNEAERHLDLEESGIYLPEQEVYCPSSEALEYHYEEIFK